jgi:RecA-family ATPase
MKEKVKAPPPKEPLTLIDPTKLQGVSIPERRWVVNKWIPQDYVTGLYGDGGTGKSLIAQQLATCMALPEQPWFGLTTAPMRTLVLNCEDQLEEMHRRQDAINQLYKCQFTDLKAMRWLPRLGYDNILMAFEGGHPVLTSFAHELVEAALDHQAKLVIVDTVSDTFGGNENDRSQVRQYVQAALGYIARRIGGTVLACAHPSRAGLSSGEGSSGSTAWSNAFRSRLSFEAAKEDKERTPDPDARFLSRRKGNYARRSPDTISVQWSDGAFITVDDDVNRPAVEDVFLGLLDRVTKDKQTVSPNSRASNYAPKIFTQMTGHAGYRRADFEKAMTALLRNGVIVRRQKGRPGKETTCIERDVVAGFKATTVPRDEIPF